MQRVLLTGIIAAVLLAMPVATVAQGTRTPDPAPVAVDQGPDWTEGSRNAFYSADQGSRLIPLAWIRSLKLPDGRPFVDDGLARYGYLPNSASRDGLPVGFTSAGDQGKKVLGMTCAACHTRQIEHGGTAYRIDGGPAIVDFQSFMADLDDAVTKVVRDGTAFGPFAKAVLGDQHSAVRAAKLQEDVAKWHEANHALMSRALPRDNPWGLGRLDAVAMIFNRLTGLDLGEGRSPIIVENIQRADAPVRYPFLWNAWKHNFTQWAGFVPNDDPLLRLGRNVGQVLGVFAEFRPRKAPATALGVDYLSGNSAHFANLETLERMTALIRPPRWPWTLDRALADAGETIFMKACAECHRSDNQSLPWATPVVSVDELQTDFRQLEMLRRKAKTGVLEGAKLPFLGEPLGAEETARQILTFATVGSVLGYLESTSGGDTNRRRVAEAEKKVDASRKQRAMSGQTGPGYEARVLQGVWAAAPFLHNGSVPTLADLLKPTAERPARFKVGPAYDPETVGLAVEQTKFNATMTTTDCGDRGSGNSRCGHEYGTTLTADEKRALLEYLKKL